MLNHYSAVPEALQAYLNVNSGREIPYQYMRMGLMTVVAALLSRRAYVNFGDSALYPNMYTILVGEPATRKNSVITYLKGLAAYAGYDLFSSTHTNRSTLLKELRCPMDARRKQSLNAVVSAATQDLSRKLTTGINLKDWMFDGLKEDYNVDDPNALVVVDDDEIIPEAEKTSELFLCLEELVDITSKQGNSDLFTTLNNLWDAPPVYTDAPSSQVVVRPTVNVLGGLNPASFGKVFLKTELGSGLITRVLIVRGIPTKRKLSPLAIKTDPNVDKLLIQFFKRIMKFSGEIKFSSDATDLYNLIYEKQPRVRDARFDSYNERRFVHLAKMCMVNAACRDSHTIHRDDVMYCNTLLTFLEINMGRALGDYEVDKRSQTLNTIVNYLSTLPDRSATTREIGSYLSGTYTSVEVAAGISLGTHKSVITMAAGSKIYLNDANEDYQYDKILYDSTIIHEWGTEDKYG